NVVIRVRGRKRERQDLGACALGDGKRRLVREELAVRGELVYREEVDARRDVLLGQSPLVVVTAAACSLRVDPDDVQVVRMRVAWVGGERLDPVETGDGLVVHGELAPADLAVALDLV